jgi:hypothetical protein
MASTTTKKKTTRKPKPRVKVEYETKLSVEGWYQSDASYSGAGKGYADKFTGKVKDGEITLTTGCGGQSATFKVEDLEQVVALAKQKVNIVPE